MFLKSTSILPWYPLMILLGTGIPSRPLPVLPLLLAWLLMSSLALVSFLFIEIFVRHSLVTAAASTDLETGFSRGGLTVLKLRHSLSDQSVRATTIVGSWLRLGIPGVLDEAELLEGLRDKPKRSNKGKGKAIESDIDVQVVE